jgi:mRNA interferase MazF
MPNTIVYNRGAVVLLPFPFSDQSAVKLRPAVIVNPDYPSDDLLVVAISSAPGRLRPGECKLEGWREAGLLYQSFLKRAVSSISASLVKKKIGDLTRADTARLNSALNLWFGLAS